MVAYAIAGTVLKDLMTEPVGKGKGGKDVYLGDIWPTSDEIAALMKHAMNGKAFKANYDKVASEPGTLWEKIKGVQGQVYSWPDSTYIAKPPFFDGFEMQPHHAEIGVKGARAIGLFGDSITTDHISPAGAIKEASPAGQWLKENGVVKADFNSYGSRRGNHDVMMRGTFANVRIKNLMIPADANGSREEGGVTLFQPGGEKMFIYDAAMKYMAEGTPTIVFGGEEYGTGSSRDWAAKGTQLLGIKAVVAKSFERIHRSNLVGMGVLPLQFKPGDSWESLGIKGDETFDVVIVADLQAAAGRDAGDPLGRRQQPRGAAHAADRHADRGRLLPARRHPAVRAAAAAGGLSAAAIALPAPTAASSGSPPSQNRRGAGRRRPGPSPCRRRAPCRRGARSPGR